MKLEERFKECKLELHPSKTKIIFCRDYRRKIESSVEIKKVTNKLKALDL